MWFILGMRLYVNSQDGYTIQIILLVECWFYLALRGYSALPFYGKIPTRIPNHVAKSYRSERWPNKFDVTGLVLHHNICLRDYDRLLRRLLSQRPSVRINRKSNREAVRRRNLTHCWHKTGLNNNYIMTFPIPPCECYHSQRKVRIWCSKQEPFPVLLPLLRHVP